MRRNRVEGRYVSRSSTVRALGTVLPMLFGSWSLAAQEVPLVADPAAVAGLLQGSSEGSRLGSRLATSGGRVFHRTESRVTNLRTVPVSASSTELYLWDEETPEGGVRPFYAISFDGLEIAGRVRQTDYTIELEGRRFDPLEQEPRPSPVLTARPENTLYLVQFFTTPLPELRAAIVARGGNIHRFLTHHTFLVEMTPRTLSEVSALPYVRWIGPYHPAFRLEKLLHDAIAGVAQRLPYQRYSILLCERGPRPQEVVLARVQRLGGEVHLTTPQGFRMEASLSHAGLAELVHANEVQYVDRWGGPGETDMDIVRRVGGADFIERFGVTGQGVKGGVFDTAVRASHQEWSDRPPMFQRPPVFSPFGSMDPHGTAVYGNLFAQGVHPSARGVIPGGQGIFFPHSRSSQFGGKVTRYTINEELLDPGRRFRAVFQTSSVGSKPTLGYSTISAEMDDVLFLHQILTTQSQGNTGDRRSRPQAWAKNIVSCGGVWHENTAAPEDDSGTSPASVGPAADGRVKPDLAGFFDGIHSASNDNDSSYMNFTGTSTATPQVAGYFGLLHQMWHDGVWLGHGGGATVFKSRPKMATAKALMIHHAARYDWVGCGDCDIDRFKQGWGRPDIKRLATTADETSVVETDLVGPLGIRTYTRFVPPGDDELKATLVYTDPMGMPGAAVARVNDLSLRVTSPSGAVFWGNYGLAAGNFSIPGGQSNTVDTVENVFVQEPESGDWTIEVIADEVVQDSHLGTTQEIDADYALVVSSVVVAEECSFSADFDGSTEGFEFIGDASNPDQVSGELAESALTVTLGNRDNSEVFGMSGGWRKTCSLPVPTTVTLTVDLSLTQSAHYEVDEISEAFVSIDGEPFTLLHIEGNGNGGQPRTVSDSVEVSLALDAGSHEIAVGCSNSHRDMPNEVTSCRIDAVTVRDQEPAQGPRAILHSDYDLDTDNYTFVRDPQTPFLTFGFRAPNGGLCCADDCSCGGALGIRVGNRGGRPAFDMIGKWTTSFAAFAETVTVTLDASVTRSPEYESDEISEARLVVDGQRVTLARLTAESPVQTTGFQSFSEEFNLETMPLHTLDLECFNNKKDAGNEVTVCLFDDVRVSITVACPVVTDFESGAEGWANVPSSTCTTGSFVVGTPGEVTSGGVTTQVGGDHTTGSGNALFSAFNTAAGTDDVDGGNCIAVSPVYSLTEESEVSIMYFHGQRDAGDDAAGDFFLLELMNNGSVFSQLASIGDVTSNAAWTEATATVPAGSNVQFRVQVSDGPAAGDLIEAGIDDLAICAAGAADTPPLVSITTPVDCGIFTAGEPVTFAATAADREDGDLTAGLSWFSSLDGAIGSGEGFTTSMLSVGEHTVTASVADSGGLVGSGSIALTVNPVPP